MFAEIAEKKGDYKNFDEQFGKCFKLGAYEDSTSRTIVAERMRYLTSKAGDEQLPFYYITGESIAAVSSSPFLEVRNKGLEVVYMADPIDEHSVQLKEVDAKKLKSTSRVPVVGPGHHLPVNETSVGRRVAVYSVQKIRR